MASGSTDTVDRLRRYAALSPRRGSGDTSVMAEESTYPDFVERWRRAAAVTSPSDIDAVDRAVSIFDPDVVWESRAGTFEGAATVRGFLEEWWGNFQEGTNTVVEARDLGNGVMCAAHRLDGRPAGSERLVQERLGYTVVWAQGLVVRVIVHADIDEARAAAERLAEDRG